MLELGIFAIKDNIKIFVTLKMIPGQLKRIEKRS